MRQHSLVETVLDWESRELVSVPALSLNHYMTLGQSLPHSVSRSLLSVWSNCKLFRTVSPNVVVPHLAQLGPPLCWSLQVLL